MWRGCMCWGREGGNPVPCSSPPHQGLTQFVVTWLGSRAAASPALQEGTEHEGREAQKDSGTCRSHTLSRQLWLPAASCLAELLVAMWAPDSRHRDTRQNSSRPLPKLHFSAIKTFVKEDLILLLYSAMSNRFGSIFLNVLRNGYSQQ